MKLSSYQVLFFVSLFVLLLTIEMAASPIRTANYNFYKDLTPISNNGKSEWGSVELDEEVYKSSYYDDIRLVHSGKQLPYVRQIKRISAGESGVVKPKIIFQKKTNLEQIYVFEIPNIPDKSRLQEMIVDSSDNFDGQVFYYLGNEIDKWVIQRSSFLYKYYDADDTSAGKISLNIDHYKYLRMEIKNNIPLTFPYIKYEPKTQISQIENNLEIPSKKINADRNSTIYYFENPENKPFQSIELEFVEKSFNRKYEIYRLDESKEYISINRGNIYSSVLDNKDLTNQNIIHLNSTIFSSWKIEIFDEDNESLNLSKITVTHPIEEILFKIPNEQDSLSKIQLYYGYKYATNPNYDTYDFPRANIDLIPINNYTLTEEVINLDKSFSIFEPPVSIWLTRFIFLFGSLMIGYFGYRVLSQWSNPKLESN